MNALCNTLLVGVTGSISAVQVPSSLGFLRRGLVGRTRVIMTASAMRLVSPTGMGVFAGEAPFTDIFDTRLDIGVAHIQLTREADALLVMPASANIIAKAAHGIADDLLSTCIVAAPGPVIFAPCMNEVMWANRAVRGNVERLRGFGYHIVEPVLGYEVADLKPTYGAMAPLQAVIGVLGEVLKPNLPMPR